MLKQEHIRQEQGIQSDIKKKKNWYIGFKISQIKKKKQLMKSIPFEKWIVLMPTFVVFCQISLQSTEINNLYRIFSWTIFISVKTISSFTFKKCKKQ